MQIKMKRDKWQSTACDDICLYIKNVTLQLKTQTDKVSAQNLLACNFNSAAF